MPTLIEQVQALLDPLAAGGAWYGANTTQQPVYPYIVWQRIVSIPNVSLQGPSDMQNTNVQIDIYARQISQAAGIETAMEAALAAASLSNVPTLSQDFYEPDVKAYRLLKEYSFWSTA